MAPNMHREATNCDCAAMEFYVCCSAHRTRMTSASQIAERPRSALQAALKYQGWKTAVLVGLVAWLYSPILVRLTEQWWSDSNFSHCFFVPAFSAFLVWRERSRLATIVPKPTDWGLPLLIIAMSLLAVGVLGAEIFLPRISLLVLIAGLITFFLGWRYFRAMLFPWAFLVLMVPIPAILFEQITFPLQILASKSAAILLPLVGVPVLREGNIISLPSISLEVAQACSGIRSILSLVTLAIVYGYLTEYRVSTRFVLALASIPIAVGANCLRIVGTGMLAQYWDPSKAEGFFHAFSGWLIFIASLSALAIVQQLLRVTQREEGRRT
jgi:exosortase